MERVSITVRAIGGVARKFLRHYRPARFARRLLPFCCAGDCSAFGAWSPQHVQRWMWLPGQVDQPILAQSPQVRLYGMKGPEPCCLAKASNFSRFAPGRLKPCTMTEALLNAPCPSDGHGWCCTMKGEFARCMCVPRSSEILEIQYPSMLSCSGQQAKLDFFGPCRRDVAAS